MAQVMVLTRPDGTTQVAHIGSPFLAVVFEEQFKRQPDTAYDNGWMAFYDAYDRPPADRDELMGWLKQFVATDLADLSSLPDPTMVATNGAVEQDSSSLT